LKHYKIDEGEESKTPSELYAKSFRVTDASGRETDVILSKFFLGQFFQDWAIFTSIFAEELGKVGQKKMVYVDLAAAWPSQISNTFFFDACLGWEGVCVEADSSKQGALLANRGCVLVDTCVTDVSGEVLYINPNNKTGGNRMIPKAQQTSETLECVTLDDVLKATQVTHVDFLSLDVEGGEAKVLRGIDFSKVRIEMIVMEVQEMLSSTSVWKPNAIKVANVLKRNNYLPVIAFPGLCTWGALKTYDDLFVGHVDGLRKYQHHDVLFILKDSEYLKKVVNWFAELSKLPQFVRCVELKELLKEDFGAVNDVNS